MMSIISIFQCRFLQLISLGFWLYSPHIAVANTEVEGYLDPSPTFNGIWSLSAELDKNDVQGDFPKFLLESKIIHYEDGALVQGDMVIAAPKVLGESSIKQRLHISRYSVDDDNVAQINIEFETSNGHYTGTLRYHAVYFDERSEGWHGMLYRNSKAEAFVRFSRSETVELKHRYQGEYSADESQAIRIEDQQQGLAIGPMQANWRLFSHDTPLMRLQLLHNLNSSKGNGSFVVMGAGAALLGDPDTSGEGIKFQVLGPHRLSIDIKVSSQHYRLRLIDDDASFNAKDWIDTSFENGDIAWTGTLQAHSPTQSLMGEAVPVILIKEKAISAVPSQADNRHQISDVVFICKQAECRYTHPETGLSNIPLLQDWAIDVPYFYTTAAGIIAEEPTIRFSNTKNGQWLALNPRMMMDADDLSCDRFGRNGRLSEEHELCASTAEVPYDEATGDLGSLRERIEFWLSDR